MKSHASVQPMPRIEPTGPPGADFSAVLALLLEMNDRLTRIEERLTPRRHASDDAAVLRRLLPALAGAIGSSVFTTHEVLANAVFVELLGPLNSHQAGNLFSRFADVDVDGLCLERLKPEHGRRMWRVVSKLPGSP